jgi:8-oxo-dGTP pyrophosphatase MutT (NUDIX family)
MIMEHADARIEEIAEAVHAYLALRPGDADRLSELRRRLSSDRDGLIDRSCMAGHVTASGLLLSRDRRRVALVHHLSLARLLQPGGHHEGGGTPLDEAVREVVEETGARDARLVGPDVPLDVDTHPIPANPRKGEEEHLHHDILYLLGTCMEDDDLVAQEDEVERVEWFDLGDLASGDGRLARAASRALVIVAALG